MPQRIGTDTLFLPTRPGVLGHAAVAGKKEAVGPLAAYFDQTFTDSRIGMKTWEQAEAKMQTEAVRLAFARAGVKPEEVQAVFAGDLLNQCISSTFGLRELGVPFIGQYGACSTIAQSAAVAAVFVDSGACEKAAAVTSSHFCTAERQFRLPLEYGGQRTPTAQWTATAAGALVLGRTGGTVGVEHVTFGRITDLGVTDPANMGAAMAPAAAATLQAFFTDTHTTPGDYDAVFTGDLGLVGSALLAELLRKNGIDISKKHRDCGLLLYDREKQDAHAGGSGCGCAASVLCGYILSEMEAGHLHNVVLAATGALMSTTSSQQSESIPGIAHLIHLVRKAK